MLRRLIVLLFILTSKSTYAQVYTDPIGIPTPPFGTTETAPSRPSPWTSDTTGFYYIDESTGTDSGRTYGNPTAPRATIPSTLAAGSYVEVAGTYTTDHTPITVSGTSGSPVFIQGQNIGTKPTFINRFYFEGSYGIVQYVDFRPDTAAGKHAQIINGDHLVLRHSTLVGNGSNSGGLGIFDPLAAGDKPSNVVIWNNTITDGGDSDNDVGDNDYHGVTTTYSDHIWIISNTIARNEGDGVQITGVGPASYNSAVTSEIYVGLNIISDNKQNGAWSKFATNVFYSQNNFHTNKASNSSDGACGGAQYATYNLWVLFNACYNSDYGFLVGADIEAGLTLNQFFIGNIVYAMTDSAGVYAARSGDSFSNCAFSSRASGNKYYYQNTVVQSSGHGFCLPGTVSNAAVAYYGNIVNNVIASTGRHFFIDNGSTTILSGGNLTASNYSQNIGGTVTTLAAPQTLSGNNLVRSSVEFVNEAGGDYHLQSSSAAVDIDTGANSQAIYDSFLSLYSKSIQYDISGAGRPNNLYDAGAFEYRTVLPLNIRRVKR